MHTSSLTNIYTLEKSHFPLSCVNERSNRKIAKLPHSNQGVELSEYALALKWPILAVYVFLTGSKASVVVLICLPLWNNFFNMFLSIIFFSLCLPSD